MQALVQCLCPWWFTGSEDSERASLLQNDANAASNVSNIYAALAADLPNDAGALRRETAEKLNRSPSQTPVGVDWPRLVGRMQLRSAAGDLLPPDFSAAERGHQMRTFFAAALTACSTGPAEADAQRRVLERLLEPDEVRGEIASRAAILLRALERRSGPLVLLTACTQSTLAPAALRLKLALQNAPFKDMRGAWRIALEQSQPPPGAAAGTLAFVCTHVRREQAQDGASFEFDWQLRLLLLLHSAAPSAPAAAELEPELQAVPAAEVREYRLEVVDAEVRVLSVDVAPTVPPARANALRALLTPVIIH